VATKTEIVLVDDLTRDPADTTVKFALDKTEYKIDLSDGNATEMRQALSAYIDAAQEMSGSGRRSAQASKPVYSGYDPAAVRAWAAGQGMEVNVRGRIKADVVERFQAAGNQALCVRLARRPGPGLVTDPAVPRCSSPVWSRQRSSVANSNRRSGVVGLVQRAPAGEAEARDDSRASAVSSPSAHPR